MSTTPIQILRPKVSRVEALRRFSAAKLSGLYWRVTKGPLQRLADVYVPFSIYTVRYALGRSVVKRVFASDAVAGSLDLFEFPRVPEATQLLTLITRNAIPASLPEFRASDALHEKVLRLVFQHGFFRLRDPQLQIIREAATVHVPYWLGFYGNTFVKCRALDAVRCRFEGAKASAFFEEWLAA
jgi:hypothetical protein